MTDDDGEQDVAKADPYAAIRPLVRLLGRQAAREDYKRALEAARMKSYSTERVKGTPTKIEES